MGRQKDPREVNDNRQSEEYVRGPLELSDRQCGFLLQHFLVVFRFDVAFKRKEKQKMSHVTKHGKSASVPFLSQDPQKVKPC